MTDNQNLFETFKHIETEYNLFDQELDGVRIWEYIRATVYKQIKNNSKSGENRFFPKQNKIDAVKRMLKNSLVDTPLELSETNYLFFGHPRRKLQEDGYWWDLYSDPIIDNMDINYLYAERPYFENHKKPAKTDNICYLDIIDYTIAGLLKEIDIFNYEIRSLPPSIKNAEKEFLNKYSINLDIRKRIEDYINFYKVKKKIYKNWIRRLNPNIVIVVPSSGNKIRVKAAKEEGVPVIELQHGVIHRGHISYNFPKNVTVGSFPDYILSFGEFWETNANFPIPSSRVIPVGYPYMDMQLEKYNNCVQQDKIVFLSGGSGGIGKQLSKLAVKLYEEKSVDHDIIYKLHPGEYHSWEDRFPWLVNSDIEVVDGPTPQLYKILSESTVQVGVSSTAVYEGLAFDLDTFVYNHPSSYILAPLVNNGDASLFDSADELACKINSNNNNYDDNSDNNISHYFSSDSIKQMSVVIEKLASGGTIYKPNNV